MIKPDTDDHCTPVGCSNYHCRATVWKDAEYDWKPHYVSVEIGGTVKLMKIKVRKHD